MPIEVRELVIRTHIDPPQPRSASLDSEALALLRAGIISECLEKIQDLVVRLNDR